MSKSLIQVANPSSVAVAENGIIPLGSVQRRFGCNCRLSGNAIEISGEGYYTIDCVVTAAPTAAGDVVVALYKNGEPITGASASVTVATAADIVTLPIIATIRECCCGTDNITAVLVDGAGTVSNISLRVVKA